MSPRLHRRRSIDTLLAQLGHTPDPVTGALVPAIQPSTTFARDAGYALPSEFSYARAGHPNAATLEPVLAELEGGAASMVFGAGMAAIATIIDSVPSGSRITAPRIMYHGTRDWLNHVAAGRGIVIDWFDAAQPESLAANVVDGKTALVWIETAVNPTWDVIDIEAAARTAHGAGARLAVDSTVSPPVTCRPLELGADLVFHSATKYLNGHSDVTAGVVTTKRDDAIWAAMSTHRTLVGALPGAFDVWLLGRGLRTLALRFERASASALAIADRLRRHPGIERVLYPGLESHPGHAIAARQMRNGFGGMLSLLVRGDAARALAVAGRLQVFARATSLGGVESLVEHRATIEGTANGVAPNLLRLSIGIESTQDLIDDLEQALD